MRGKVVTIWDGIQYRQVSPEEAARLVKKDMAQICPVGGTEMKFRKQFTGYQTREVRADAPAVPTPPRLKPEPKPKAAPPRLKPEPEPKAKPWTHYKKAAAKYHGKTVKKTNKADVLAYMEKHLGTEG